MKLSINEAKALAIKSLVSNNISIHDAEIMADIYIEAELRGKNSHGLKIIPWVLKQLQEVTSGEISVIKEDACSLYLDGGMKPGCPVAYELMQRLIQKSKESSIVIGGIKNAGHIGILGYYAAMATKNNLIAIIVGTTPSVTVAYGGTEAVLGTNPICIGIPRENQTSIILDMGTTKLAYHKVLMAKANNTVLPENAALTKDGKPTMLGNEADPFKLIPFENYRGFGLSLIVELLAGALTGSKVGTQKTGGIRNDYFGTTMIVTRPNVFIEENEFNERVESLSNDIKNSPKIKGTNEIYLPFEQSSAIKKENLKKGYIEISEELYETLFKLAENGK